MRFYFYRFSAQRFPFLLSILLAVSVSLGLGTVAHSDEAAQPMKKAENYHHDEYGSEAEIPEPMMFDLVRRLGAQKGEFEINSLFYQEDGSGFQQFYYAPEVEWAFADGYAVELELPMKGDRNESHKAALQVTLGPPGSTNPGVQGLQFIGERKHGDRMTEFTSLYLHGQRLNRDWSYLIMLGARTDSEDAGPTHGFGVLNTTFFYNYGRKVDAAIELNAVSNFFDSWSLRLIPQAHLLFGKSTKIQFGAGISRQDSYWGPIFAFRIIEEFND
ncbi:MAG: hypothetical protein COT74_04680 [Bdellovibrionales bacterium CG10_big_fil_rev_8_21_14_0_10_45_34]|nr:MAG: hypothetical protein COT74_04680 [Bdellovibrionales bacterium CG10_big_fil_rev_8_21_14_0_10_45_34]